MKRISSTEYRIENINKEEILEVVKTIDIDDLFCQADFEGRKASEAIGVEVGEDEYIEIIITAWYNFRHEVGDYSTPPSHESELDEVEVECYEIDNPLLCEIEKILMS